MKHFTFLLLFVTSIALSQITFQVTLPTNTPANDLVYVTGTFNNWNPADPVYVLHLNNQTGFYEVTIPQGTGTVECKFTRGSWATVEGNATGGYRPNRSYTYASGPQVIAFPILSWGRFRNRSCRNRSIQRTNSKQLVRHSAIEHDAKNMVVPAAGL